MSAASWAVSSCWHLSRWGSAGRGVGETLTRLWGREGRQNTRARCRGGTKRRWEKNCPAWRLFTLSHVWGKASHSSPVERVPGGPENGRDGEGEPAYLHLPHGEAGAGQGHLPPIITCSDFLNPLRDGTQLPGWGPQRRTLYWGLDLKGKTDSGSQKSDEHKGHHN